MSKFHFGALSWSLPLSSFCNLSLLLEVFQTFNIHSLKNIQWCVSEFGDNLGEGWQDELICWGQSRACWIFKTRLASIESKLAGKYLSVHEIKWLCLCPQQAIPRTTGAIFCTPHSELWWKENSLQPFSPIARVHAGEVVKPWAASPASCQTVCLSLQQTLVNRFVYAGLGMFTSLKFTSLSLTIILPCRHH